MQVTPQPPSELLIVQEVAPGPPDWQADTIRFPEKLRSISIHISFEINMPSDPSNGVNDIGITAKNNSIMNVKAFM
jgi:hypothetical protein